LLISVDALRSESLLINHAVKPRPLGRWRMSSSNTTTDERSDIVFKDIKKIVDL